MNSAAKNSSLKPGPTAGRVLVVEDDHVSLRFLQLALGKQGYRIATAEDAADARRQLSPEFIRTFECVVTDYRMPDSSGLDLLAWIQQRDASLATIIVTAEGEKNLVAESLRGGAVDFLEKPVALDKLYAAVARAVDHTRRLRHLNDSDSAVKQLGNVQERMLSGQVVNNCVRMDVCFHPKHEAGGDFFTHFQPATDRHFCLLTDVSGHDLQAAYISSYFQGLVRGMLERATPIEEIFSTFNRLLLDEWSQSRQTGKQTKGIGASVAACAILIDSAAQNATVLAHGTPAPVYWRPDGEAQMVADTGGFPLGWFPDLEVRGTVQAIPDGGSFCLWTDGLEDMAAQLGVSELSLAWALQQAKSRGERLAAIDQAGDDILAVEIHLSADQQAKYAFRPLLVQEYHGGQAGEIDELQAFWQRSLTLAVPEMPEAQLHDILLASRETVLNALKHGCQSSPDRKASFQIACAASSQTFRVRICDPGPGHGFDFKQYEQQAADNLLTEHRGLILVHHLAGKMNFERQGAAVTMDFP